ncbi:HAMP domain-containing protein [Cohnella sp. CFH 77786]|uniref:sensor histidine kinase n=1 Tax=Cohnella sp. CFH 77786 TaxID=2662265 RepID=UPI001C608DD5|nr:sensor histidine kinase [Cohnella sp. CFH 77786]MBW5445164.1 HAMP domain-containing protein [Cohnella sp. CFH 77786]
MSRLLVIQEYLNNVRIKNKLILSYVLVVFIPVLIVGIFLTARYRQDVIEQATLQTINNVDRVKQRMLDLTRVPTAISRNLQADRKLMYTVNAEYPTTLDVVHAYWDYSNFKEYLEQNKEISSIRFYTTNPSLLDNWEFIKVTDKIENAFWYRNAMKQNIVHWFDLADETKENKKYLSLVRKITFPQFRTSGVLVIAVNEDQLNGILRQEPFDTMIVDEQGFIAASNHAAWNHAHISELQLGNQLTGKPTGTYQIKYNGKLCKAIVEDLQPQTSGIHIISIFEIDSIVNEAKHVSILGFLIIAGSLLIAIILIYMFSGVLSRRIRVLNRELYKVGLGDLRIISEIRGNDEIGLLSRQFNNMVASLRRLMDEVAESQRIKNRLELRQRDIKLKMMASQINPHFLFNALESIRMNAHIKGQDQLASVVEMLGFIIRRNLDIGSRNIPLEDELESVRCYLEVQKFRLGDDRLTFRIHMDPKVEGQEFHIPPLVIQPLVENAVVHGLDDVEQGGKIDISIYKSGGFIRFEVTDNGCGIPEAKRKEILSSLSDMEETENYRIGLRNVHQRLYMMYGEPCGLVIDTEEGKGTRVSFQIPLGGTQLGNASESA